MLLASGLALQGAKPVCAIYSTFLQRAYDQIIHDVCLQELDVTFAMDRAGLVGDDGPTHHGAFDVSYFRPIPNVVRDGPARRGDAGPHAAHRDRPRRPGGAALPARGGRGGGDAGGAEGDPDRQRRAARRAASGSRCSATATASRSRWRRRRSSPGTTCKPTVADARFAKPLDAELLERLALDHDLVVTIEENVLPGRLRLRRPRAPRGRLRRPPEERARVLRVGLPDRYVTHGKPALLRDEVGLTGESVAERVLAALRSGEPVLS